MGGTRVAVTDQRIRGKDGRVVHTGTRVAVTMLMRMHLSIATDMIAGIFRMEDGGRDVGWNLRATIHIFRITTTTSSIHITMNTQDTTLGTDQVMGQFHTARGMNTAGSGHSHHLDRIAPTRHVNGIVAAAAAAAAAEGPGCVAAADDELPRVTELAGATGKVKDAMHDMVTTAGLHIVNFLQGDTAALGMKSIMKKSMRGKSTMSLKQMGVMPPLRVAAR